MNETLKDHRKYDTNWFPVKRLSNRKKSPTTGCACAHPTLPKEARRDRVTFDDVTSGEKTPLGQILRNFWNLFGVTWRLMTSHLVAMSVMRNGTFCTTTIVRKKAGTGCTCLRDHFRSRDWRHLCSRHFQSRDLRWRYFRSGPGDVTSGSTYWNMGWTVLILLRTNVQ